MAHHGRNEDIYLNKGGINEVSAADVKDAVTKKHTQNSDEYLNTEVSKFTRYVDCNRTDSYTPNGSITKPYKTIQSAIDSITVGVNEHYVVAIYSGYYVENIVLKDHVSLTGLGASGCYIIIDAPAGDTVTGTNLTDGNFENLLVINNWGGYCFKLTNSTINILNPNLRGNGNGLYVNGGSAILLNCTSTLTGKVIYATNGGTVNLLNVSADSTTDDAIVAELGGIIALCSCFITSGAGKKDINADAYSVVLWGNVRCDLAKVTYVNRLPMYSDIVSSGDLFIKSGGKISDGTYEATIANIKDAVDKKHDGTTQADKYITINEQTDNYTLVLTDDGKLIDMNKETACILTVPKNAVVAFPIGTSIAIRQKGLGQVTITPIDGDVTINNPDGLIIDKQYAIVSLLKINTDTWTVTSSVELLWDSIIGRPSSAVVDIDDAVDKKHEHLNKAVLDGTEEEFTTVLKTKLDDIINPMLFKGSISVAADFPTLAEVKNGWVYRIAADVTDNDPTKTNTGQSFLQDAEISWNGTNWTDLGYGQVKSVAGKTGIVTLVKGDVGLGNVDNKSEATIISDVKADGDVADALTKRHTQGTDQKLDEGGLNEVTAANAKDAVDKKHEHSNKTVLDAIQEALTTALKSAYDGAVTDSHTHSNKTTLDAIQEAFTTALKSAYDSCVANEHTHSNKTTLDAIQEAFTTALKSAYDSCVANEHTHSNKTTLDAIQEALTTALKTAYDGAVTHAGLTSGNPHQVTKSDVGLGNVTNDAQAKELFTGYPEKTTLVDADLIIINDSAQSNAIKKVTKANLLAGVSVTLTRGTFTNGSLVGGKLTVVHNKGLSAPYTLILVVFDNNNKQIIPDDITGASNQVEIDLTSYGTIAGTWGYGYIA